MSKTPTTSPDEAGDDARYRSPYVPPLKDDAERERFKRSMLDELELATRLGLLRPADDTPDTDDQPAG